MVLAGVFSVEHPEISAAMLERKIANIDDTGAPLVVPVMRDAIQTSTAGCTARENIQRAVHIAEILDQTSLTEMRGSSS